MAKSSGPNIKALDALGSLKVHRMSAEQADYMELDGALKDADCEKVEVDGGVSKDLGCCNEFDPEHDAQKFSCGTCTFLLDSRHD